MAAARPQRWYGNRSRPGLAFTDVTKERADQVGACGWAFVFAPQPVADHTFLRQNEPISGLRITGMMVLERGMVEFIGEGARAAVDGEPLSANPYPLNSEEYFEWEDSWHQFRGLNSEEQ